MAPLVRNPPASADPGLIPGSGRSPRGGNGSLVFSVQEPPPVFLPGECHGQRSLAGYGPGCGRVGLDWSDLTRVYIPTLQIRKLKISELKRKNDHDHSAYLWYGCNLNLSVSTSKVFSLNCWQSTAGTPYFWDLMPDHLRWSWCYNRNEVHNKCSMLESSPNHPHPTPWSVEKLSSTKLVPGAKMVVDRWSTAFHFLFFAQNPKAPLFWLEFYHLFVAKNYSKTSP